MQFWDAFVNVIAIIAIIGVGAFIMIFIGDLLLNVIDNRSGIFFKRSKNGKEKTNELTHTNETQYAETAKNEQIVQAQKETEIPQIKNETTQKKIENDDYLYKTFKEQPFDKEQFQKVDFDKAFQEELALKEKLGLSDKGINLDADSQINLDDDEFFDLIKPTKKIAENKEISDEQYKKQIFDMVDQIKNEVFEVHANSKLAEFEKNMLKATGGKTIDDYSKELSAYSLDNMKIKESVKAVEPEDEIPTFKSADKDDLHKIIAQSFETQDEADEGKSENSMAESEAADDAAIEIKKLTDEQETAEMQKETAEIKRESEKESDIEKQAKDEEIKSLKQQIKDLEEQLKLERAKDKKDKIALALNADEDAYLERINVLEERLKNSKKAFKTNSKEFKPLEKVKKTLEKDKAKLRRKEAIVARQKVDLYGVNNYVDIDQDKADKLASELELLEGLRLSVQHCEEVLESNKERYPILEQTNKILQTDIDNIEKDLKDAHTALKLLREKDNK